MNNNFYIVPPAQNEPVLSYAPGTQEREELKHTLECFNNGMVEIPMVIGGKEVKTNDHVDIAPPHNHKHKIGFYHKGGKEHLQMAIDAALAAKEKWENMSWKSRASIFLKAANLLAGPYRYRMNAATMIGQSKNPFQSEIDAVAELVDFFRFNVRYMTEIMEQQPQSNAMNWNRTEQRPLEGFVLAISPFNFTSIGGNLPTAPAMMGNTVVWKPAQTQAYSARIIMEILQEAGLPDGVINMVFVSGRDTSDVCFNHRDFAGVHFTGSTAVFQDIWKTIGNNIHNYKSYPRIVGETGGKNFILVHDSARASQVGTAITRGGFEYQGQKCSAVSRVYISKKFWPIIKEEIKCDLDMMKMGSPDDFGNFFNAVIDEKAFNNISGFIDRAKEAKDAEIIFGGSYDKSVGYFIEPTVILTTNPHYETIEEEIFGPVVTIYLYEDGKFEETIDLVNNTSIYGLTGAIFAKDRAVVELALQKLKHAAGNFYINDKPTGAVVGQQPFGGGRGSGTNDKAGSSINLLRWVSPRTIKENFLPDNSFKYPFLGE
ncbi:MAG: L-glutamate gamma-semialdehyde dehydrogenase [Salinivirgaceae bacterium]|nr:L-glutamate gamma-semialdehyde dehydrogenase [Salinivirgaceae bacterium]